MLSRSNSLLRLKALTDHKWLTKVPFEHVRFFLFECETLYVGKNHITTFKGNLKHSFTFNGNSIPTISYRTRFRNPHLDQSKRKYEWWHLSNFIRCADDLSDPFAGK